MPRRFTTRVAAAAVATVLPLSALSVAGTGAAFATPADASDAHSAPTGTGADIAAPFDSRKAAEDDGYVTEGKASWRDYVYNEDGSRKENIEELKVTSEANQGRQIPVVVIKAQEDAENAPTLYLLNGADGGEGTANWLHQTTAANFYGDRIGNVNVVIPMAGVVSYYTDWQNETDNLDTDAEGNGGVQRWETFLTQELPGPMENYLGSTGNTRGLIGMSMTGSTSLVYAQKYPGFYDAIGAYSGCAATSGEAAPITNLVLNQWNAEYEDMWGDPYSDAARENDALVNAEKLADQHNIYVSSGTGLVGEHDVTSGDRMGGRSITMAVPMTSGFAIEAGTNVCTHMLKSTTDAAGITERSNNLVYNLHPTGTHQWGYWQDDMFDSWPTISAGLFPEQDPVIAEEQTRTAKEAFLAANPGLGAAGSSPSRESAEYRNFVIDTVVDAFRNMDTDETTEETED